MKNVTIVDYNHVKVMFFYVKELFVKKVPILIMGLLVLVAGYLYASPYLALNNIKSAAQARDAEKLSGYVDFPSVKQGVKDQVKAKFATEMLTGEDKGGFEALGSMFATAMIDQLVDGLVSPEGLAVMMSGEQDQASKEAATTQEQSSPSDNLEYETGYDSFSDFHINLINPTTDKTVKVMLHRDGLNWKIVDIDFPFDEF